MHSKTPKVSVLTPIYNTNPQHLRECVESILNQTFKDFEFLIVNDSPDNTEIERIVKSYKDKRIKYIRNEVNMGISAVRNKLLELSTGEYLAIFDHDDISMPERLEKQVAYLDANKEVGVCGCHTEWFPKIERQNFPEDNLRIKFELMDRCCVPHSGAMIRKSVMVDNDIKWESAYSPAEDFMLWVRLVGKTMFHNIPEVLLRYRNVDGNTTHRQKARMTDRDALIRSIAYKEYPYLVKGYANLIKRRWIKLFNFIPVIRITNGRERKIKFYLFGLIPLFSVNNVFVKGE